MAQPHSRGHESHTYDILEIVDIDEPTRTLTLRVAHQVAPLAVSLTDRDRPISVQLFRGCVDSLALTGKGGRWESAQTIGRTLPYVNTLVAAFLDLEVTDITDTKVDLQLLRDVIAEFDSSQKRTLVWLLARVLKTEGHHDQRLPSNLKNSKFQVDEHTSRNSYTDEEINHIESVARAHVADAIKAQRELLEALGYDTAGNAWTHPTAADIIAAARERDRQRPAGAALAGGAPPLASAPLIDHADWALLNPDHAFAAFNQHHKAQHHKVLRALYPPTDVLIAGLAVQTLADNTGVNTSVLLREHADNLQPTGEHTGLLGFAKARNHTAGTRPVKLDGAFSSGGIVRTMTALTRFLRHHRNARLDAAGLLEDHAEIARRIYVIDDPDITRSRTLDSATLAQQARRGPLYARLDDDWPGGGRATLRFASLRVGALVRGVKQDPLHDVVDHTPRTRIDYFAHALPDVDLHQLITEAQDDIHSSALASFTNPEATEQLVKAAQRGHLQDLRATACTNNGRDPDASPDATGVDSWCSRGLAACFVCPNGYRTLDHAPGLVALAEYTERLAQGNPTEWVDGDAGVLNHYATETLRKFPPNVVDQARSQMDRTVELLDIHELYTEFRR